MPGHFTIEDVERVARLARLALTDDEKALFSRQLAHVLAYAEQIQEVDTAGIPPTASTLPPGAALRADDPRPSLPREAALSQAPDADRDAGLFKVPRVIG